MAEAKQLVVVPYDSAGVALWNAVADLADGDLADRTGWCLVGGLMVQLFAFEYAARARSTTDIDVLADSRGRPSRTEEIARHLKARGATMRTPARDGTAYQFDFNGQLVEVLGPGGTGREARTLGKLKTVSIPGGTQALKRMEEVVVVLGERRVRLRRPNLTGAVLLKARSLAKHLDPESQREDLVMLLSFIADPGAMRDELSAGERGWLRSVRDRLDLDAPDASSRFPAETLRRAQQAYRLLIR
ncbi:MAG: hypothetical protein QOI91_2809 [Solirubrobacteraceae bacterium]|jgi:hypothetical protein|nr:hypothetical protein [Solirubrobacteraceae bacterium]